MSDREASELEGMVRRVLRALVRRAAEGDTTALEALAEVERTATTATSVALLRASRGNGGFYSWGELAMVTGTSRQAVQQRVDRLARVADPGLVVWLCHQPREADPL